MKTFEFLNRVELRGIVGSEPKITEVGGTAAARFPLCTNETCRDSAGTVCIETTWHSVTAWAGPRVCNLADIHKGDAVHVEGRLGYNYYTCPSGEQRSAVEVRVTRMHKVSAAGE